MTILYLPKFARQYKRLPVKIKDLAEEKEKIFRKDPFDPRLKTHKLHGELKDFYAFSVSYDYRVIFDFADKNIARLYSIGKHDVYE